MKRFSVHYFCQHYRLYKYIRLCIAFDNNSVHSWLRYDKLAEKRKFGFFLRRFIIIVDRNYHYVVSNRQPQQRKGAERKGKRERETMWMYQGKDRVTEKQWEKVRENKSFTLNPRQTLTICSLQSLNTAHYTYHHHQLVSYKFII